MFDQTFVEKSGKGRKFGSLALSLAVQIAIVLVLLITPLIYTGTLPDVARVIPLGPPSRPIADAPPIESAPSAPRQKGPSLRSYEGFVAPSRVPDTLILVDDSGSMQPELTHGDSRLFPPGSPIGSPDLGGRIAVPPPQTMPPKRQPPLAEQPKQIPIGGDVLAAKAIHQPKPVYPPLARQMRVSGVVRLVGVVGRDGRIQQLQVISGHPLLVKAAVEAVEKWIYSPTLLNKAPVEVIAPIEVNFILGN